MAERWNNDTRQESCVRDQRTLRALASSRRSGDNSQVHLTNLSPKQLDRLERAARQELDRRDRRRPIGAVRQLLRAMAEEAGHTLDALFPEFASVRRVSAPKKRSLVGSTKQTRRPRAPRPGDTASPLLDPAQQLVRALAAGDPKAAGLSQALATVRTSMGLQGNWPAFHVAMEDAARRNWLHFRGNDHCVLTPEGLAETTR